MAQNLNGRTVAVTDLTNAGLQRQDDRGVRMIEEIAEGRHDRPAAAEDQTVRAGGTADARRVHPLSTCSRRVGLP